MASLIKTLLVVIGVGNGHAAAGASHSTETLLQSSPKPALMDVTHCVLQMDEDLVSLLNKTLFHMRRNIHMHSGIQHWAPTLQEVDHSPCHSSSVRVGCITMKVQLQAARDFTEPEGFKIEVADVANSISRPTVTVVATSKDMIKLGLGRLTRELRVRSGNVKVPKNLTVHYFSNNSLWDLRGHQYTAAHYPAMFRTWEEFDGFTHDNSVFGLNQVELAHFDVTKSEDVDNLVAFSTHLDQDNVNVSFWWSLDIYTNNKENTAEAFKRMPRIDSMFFPGGDGGALVWPDIADAAKLLHAYHPHAQIWVSAQELSAENLTAFFKIIDTPEIREYLTGVVVGPHWSIPTTEIVNRMPEGYPLRQYPDICHPKESQYEIPYWSWVWQSTHGRQSINPMPLQHASIVRLRANGSTPNIGVGAYSEGLNDDLNKAIWSALAMSPELSVEDIVSQYSRYFFGADLENQMTELLFGLEQNWHGDPATNSQIRNTLALAQDIESIAPREKLASNWRLQGYLYRAYYDAIVQSRLNQQTLQEDRAMESLANAKVNGSLAAIATAKTFLELNKDDPEVDMWRQRLLQIWNLINVSIGTEVMQSQETDLTINGINETLNDRNFLLSEFDKIRAMSSEDDRLDAISIILNWTDAGPGGFYDNLGGIAPHLDRGVGPLLDPDYYQSPYTTAHPASPTSDSTTRLSWRHIAEIYFDNTLGLLFEGLDPRAKYKLDIVYYSDLPKVNKLGKSIPMPTKLMANDEVLHDFQLPPVPMAVQSFPIDQNTTAGGSLKIRCFQPPGVGGSGAACPVSEVWLRVEN